MNKSSIPVGIKSLMAWKNKGTLSFDNPIQRSGAQWTLLQKSLLVHSVIMGYPTPNIYFLKMKNDAGETLYDCIDGKQRLSSLFEFIEGAYTLHSATPAVKVNDLDCELANMSFEELADDLKDEILGCRFSIFCLEDCTDEEVEEIFMRLNNATVLSAVQKCRSIMSTDLARWTKEICKKDFFLHSIGLTVAQLRREADLEVLLQSMLLLDSRHEGYDDWKGISTSDVTKYCSHVRGRYNEDKRKMMLEIIDYLGDAFKEQHKFLKKSNVPTVIVLAKLALESDIEPERFKAFIDAFNNSLSEEYIANTGSGNVKRAKTEGRLFAIADDFDAFFDLESASILGNNRGSDSDENSEVIHDSPSSEADASDDEVSGEAVSEIDGDENSEATEDLPSSGEDMPEESVSGEVEIESGEGEIEPEDADPVEDADNNEAGEEAEEVAYGREDQGLHDEGV